MVFTPHQRKNKITILDGQQRFASVLILLAACRDSLKNSQVQKKEFWIDDINRILYKRSTPDIAKQLKLELNKEDNKYFEKLIVDGIVDKPKLNSHHLIKNNYEYLLSKISTEIKSQGNSFIEKVLDVIFNKLIIIKIEVDNDVDANLLFETLNDRGLELSASDLIKNYLYSTSESDLETVAQNWKRMSDQIGDNNISKFLRHFWISKYNFVKKEFLYKELKKEITKEKILDFSGEISTEATIYNNLISPSDDFWEDSDLSRLVNELNILRVEQVYILILSVYKVFSHQKETMKKIFRLIINFSFRYNTISGLDPKALESVYGNLAVKLRRNSINHKDIKREIERYSPSKEIFVASFNNFETKNRKLSKYILLKINNDLLTQSNQKELEANLETINLEHIIPINPNQEWIKYFKENKIDHEKLIYKLGNQTILLKEYNKKGANKFFPSKKNIYQQSNLPVTKTISDFDNFGEKETLKRQNEFAEIADKIWKV
jgi:hypothetical protein